MTLHYEKIDPAVLMDAAGDDLDGFGELLAMFLKIVPDGVRQLRQAVEAGNHAQVAEQAHSLKSCLALIGAQAAAARLAQLERAARAGQPVIAAGFDTLYDELVAVIAEALGCRAATGRLA